LSVQSGAPQAVRAPLPSMMNCRSLSPIETTDKVGLKASSMRLISRGQ
jgi:hypothetical protein